MKIYLNESDVMQEKCGAIIVKQGYDKDYNDKVCILHIRKNENKL